MSGEFKVRLLRGRAAVEGAAAGAGLTARAPASIIGAPGWVRSAYEHLHGSSAACVVLAERRGSTVGRLSLAIDRDGGKLLARVAGHPMNDLTDVLSARGEEPGTGDVVLGALHELAAEGITVDLGDLDPDGTLVAAARRHTPAAIAEGDPAPTINLAGTAPLGSLSRRKEWRRQLRRLTEEHDVEVEWSRLTASKVLDDLLALRAARFAAAGRTHELPAIEDSPAFADFLRAAVGRLAPEGRCAISALLVDGKAVARDLYLLGGDVVLLFLRGLDPGWAARAPGHLLLHACAEDLRALGAAVLDLGRGDEPYKETFGARPRTLARLQIAACGSSTS